ncbi:hypothetical protein DA2_3456 [Desulfovibrio sp. A2]|nr:hypothetical protein DA2_3456 [Desulfovibrio sp. A2]
MAPPLKSYKQITSYHNAYEAWSSEQYETRNYIHEHKRQLKR